MLTKLYVRAHLALADRKGVTAAEYAVLAVGIVLVVATAAAALGVRLGGALDSVVPAGR